MDNVPGPVSQAIYAVCNGYLYHDWDITSAGFNGFMEALGNLTWHLFN